MKKLFIVGIVLISLAALGLIIQFGLKPRPIPIINLSSFESPERMADSLVLRLNNELKGNDLLIIGISSSFEQIKLCEKLLFALSKAGIGFDSLVVDSSIVAKPEVFGKPDLVDFSKDPAKLGVALGEVLQRAKSSGKRVILIVPTVHSPQILRGNFSDKLRKQFGLQPMSLTVSAFPRNRSQEADMPIPCVVDEVDNSGTGKLGCRILKMARLNYKKNIEAKSFSGLVSQIGAKDYLILFTKE